MVCSECGLATVERDMAACPRCDTQFARPVGGLGWATFALFVAMAAALAAVLWLRQRAASPASLTAGYTVAAVVGVALATVFLVWFCRIRHNAAAWEPQSYGPGWAVGAWFLPGAGLWIPFRIALEAWSTTFESKRESWSLYAWWICWLGAWATAIVPHAHEIGYDPNPRRRRYESTFSLYLFNDVQFASAVAAALLGALVVVQLSRRQDAWISGKIIRPII